MKALYQRLPVILEWSVLLLLAFSILWRGGKGLEATWLLGGLAVLLTFVRWARNHRDHPQPTQSAPLDLWLGLMLFVLWTVVSFLFSETQNYGLDEVIRDSAGVMILLWAVWATHRVARTEPSGDFVRRLIFVLSVTAIVACAIGTAVYILQPVSRFVGTFVDMRFDTDYWPNAWAEFLLLAWPVAVLWSRKFSPAIQSLVLGVLFGSLFLSFSRGAFIVFCGQIVLWGVIAGMRYFVHARAERPYGHARILGVGFGALVIGVLLFVSINAVRSRYNEIESVAAKATFTSSEGSSSISERSDFWKQSFTLSLERPFFGWGPYSFRFIQPRLQTQVFATSDHPHNVFLKLAMERGWPAAILFLFILLRILFPALWSILTKTDDDHSPFRAAFLIAIAGVLAHNLIDYNLQFVGIALPFWLLLGLLVSPGKLVGKSKKCIRIFELLVAIILGLVLIFEGRFLVLSSFGRHAEAAGDVPAAIAWYDRARGEVFSRDMHLSRANLFLLLDDGEVAAAALDDYARVNEEDARLWILRARLAARRGEFEVALREYSVAMEFGKYNYLEPLEGTLEILSIGGHPEILVAQQSAFAEILHSFGDAILQNSHFIALSQTVEVFDRASTLFGTIYPAQSARMKEYAVRVLAHAEEERQKYASRSPGFLW